MHGSAESFYDHDLEKMAAQQVIDTKILGKGVKTFGGDLNAQPWRSFKFVWMNYVGAVSPDMRTHLKEVETQPVGTPLANFSPAVRHEAEQIAYMLSQVLEGTALTMIMNIEEGNGFEMWRTLVQYYEPDLGSYSVSNRSRTFASYSPTSSATPTRNVSWRISSPSRSR